MALFGRRQVLATVTTMAWKRTVLLEHQRWTAKQSERTPPPGVRNVQRHTGVLSLPVANPQQPQQPGMPPGSGIPGPAVAGISTEILPRYYYTYEAVEWVPGRTLAASGTSPEELRWPVDDPVVAGERERSRAGSYTASFTDGAGKTYEAELPEEQWRTLRPGASCQLTLGLLGAVKSVASQ